VHSGQCHNTFQEYGNIRNYCYHSSRCVKCDENHFTVFCTKDCWLLYKYAQCSVDHTLQNLLHRVSNSQEIDRINNETKHYRTSNSHLSPRHNKCMLAPSYANLTTTVQWSNNNFETISSFLTEIESLLNLLVSFLTVLINKLAMNSAWSIYRTYYFYLLCNSL